MKKQEIMEVHQEFVEIREKIEDVHTVTNEFEDYDELGVSPNDEYASKTQHKKAIFMLGEAISSVLSDDEFSNAGRLKKRMKELLGDLE